MEAASVSTRAGARGDLDDLTSSVVVALLFAAGLVHASIAPAHFSEWWGYGLMFTLAAAAQLGLGVAVGARRSPRALAAVVAVGMTAIIGWALSRTIGLPLAPGRRLGETAGWLDVLTTVDEAITVALILGAPSGRFGRRVRAGLQTVAAVLVGVLAVAFAAGIGHD